MARNRRIRFCDYNFAESPLSVTASSAVAAFPFSNSQNKARSKVWKPNGSFTVDSATNKLYVYDGTSELDITLDQAVYSDGDALAAHLQTKLNAASTETFTVTYSSSSYLFTFASTSSDTIYRLTNTTNAIWDTIGFLTVAEVSGASVLTDDARVHGSETVVYDMGWQSPASFFAIIGPLDESFSISPNAIVTIKGNNINDFTGSEPYSKQATVTNNGIFEWLDTTGDDEDLPAFRYWQVEIKDRGNINGPTGIKIGHIYIGTHIGLTARNVESGFRAELADPSTIGQSEAGALYFNKKTKYRTLSNLSLALLTDVDRRALEQFIFDAGISEPFYISMDPTKETTQDNDDLTMYCVFSGDPGVVHIHTDTYSIGFNVRESV